MGYISEPPPQVEIAQDHDTMLSWVEAPKLAQLKIISQNVRQSGSIGEQEAFKLVVSEIRGMVTRARAKGPEAVKQIRAEVTRAFDERILNNKAYDKFKTTTVEGPDPFGVK